MARKIRLLIVDDEPVFLETLTDRLLLRHFKVTPVSNGADALLAAQRKDFDIALVDLQMPGITGEDVLNKLKEMHPLLEVIILTGHGSIESAIRCTQAGSFTYLEKPCELDRMLEVLQEAYQKRLQRKFQVDREKMRKMLGLALVESPMGVIKRLKEFDENGSREAD
ncbi:MAG: response regulator [Deltaproteobacteria bacterium]|nr:response regulator [Deltaproteobacteria bacterium]